MWRNRHHVPSIGRLLFLNSAHLPLHSKAIAWLLAALFCNLGG
jgi:hypothetical protein